VNVFEPMTVNSKCCEEPIVPTDTLPVEIPTPIDILVSSVLVSLNLDSLSLIDSAALQAFIESVPVFNNCEEGSSYSRSQVFT